MGSCPGLRRVLFLLGVSPSGYGHLWIGVEIDWHLDEEGSAHRRLVPLGVARGSRFDEDAAGVRRQRPRRSVRACPMIPYRSLSSLPEMRKTTKFAVLTIMMEQRNALINRQCWRQAAGGVLDTLSA